MIDLFFSQATTINSTRDLILTVTAHAHGEALLKAAVLAAVPIVLVHIAILRQPALVPLVLSH